MREFLTSIKLDKYQEKFIENGVEDLETILELNDEHIELMGVPLGHKLKIMKRIKDLRAEKGMSVPPSRQGTARREAKGDTKSETETPACARGTETARSQKTEST